MAQYIDKDALVAEIEKRFDEYSSSILKHYDACTEARASELGKILILLRTLEVKERWIVDLENKVCKWLDDNCDDAGYFNQLEFAKYFFELGLKINQKGE